MARKANDFPLHEVKICGVRYSVSEVDDLRDESGEKRFYGRISHVHLTMEVEENMAKEVKIQSVLHEALHGLFHHTGNYDIEQEERIVQMLGCQLPQFLRENRALVDLIMGAEITRPIHEDARNVILASASPPKCATCGKPLGDAATKHPAYPNRYFCSVSCVETYDTAR